VGIGKLYDLQYKNVFSLRSNAVYLSMCLSVCVCLCVTCWSQRHWVPPDNRSLRSRPGTRRDPHAESHQSSWTNTQH